MKFIILPSVILTNSSRDCLVLNDISNSKGRERFSSSEVGNHFAMSRSARQPDTQRIYQISNRHVATDRGHCEEVSFMTGLETSQVGREIHRKPMAFNSFLPSFRKPEGWLGWQLPILCGALLTLFVLPCNIIVLAVFSISGQRKKSVISSADDALLLLSGSCATFEWIRLVSHLLINIFSTGMFMTSTACLQVLLAPSRSEIDASHPKGRWLHVGVIDYQTFLRIPLRRVCLGGLLVASSLPLHLL